MSSRSASSPPRTRAADASVEVGVVFPVTGLDPATGAEQRSTQVVGKAALAAALDALDGDAAQACRDERKWRFKYVRHFVRLVELSARSPEAALAAANVGLDYMHEHFQFGRAGRSLSVREAMKTYVDGTFETGFVNGSKPKPTRFELEVPYNGKVLRGDALLTQLDKWVRQGVIELSAGSAIGQVAGSEAWLDLSNKYFVLLGASAAMGPLYVLLGLGAHVVAVSRGDNPETWERMIAAAEASCGSLTFPLQPDKLPAGTPVAQLSRAQLCAAAGADLVTDAPEIRTWLMRVHPGRHLTVGGYAYLTGDRFPRVAVAMDAIMKELADVRRASLAFLGTPTDVHLVPAAAHAAAAAAWRRAPLWQHALRWFSGGTFCRRNARRPVHADGVGGVGAAAAAAPEPMHVADALVNAQGPNYALAKRVQHWRAMVAREQGCIVSSNVAPATRTASVTQNRNFAMAYEAMPAFAPHEVPGPETATAVMAALLVHDLSHPMHAGHPHATLANPQLLFASGAFHGGAWRCAFAYDSIGVPAVLLFYVRQLLQWYLLAYNAAQACGWAAVLARLALYVAGGSVGEPWRAFGAPGLLFWQNLAALEVCHALLGVVRAPWLTTAMQVASRLLVVNLVQAEPALWQVWPLLLVGACWGCTEVVRYAWYAAKLLGALLGAPSVLPLRPHTWLRYSTFLLLYPLGVLGELLLLHAALPTPLGQAAPLAAAGVPTPVASLLRAAMLAYVPGFPLLFVHMLRQRAKVLGGARECARVAHAPEKAE